MDDIEDQDMMDEEDDSAESPGGGGRAEEEAPLAGERGAGLLSRYWKILASLAIISCLGAAGLVYLFSGMRAPSGSPAGKEVAEDPGFLVPSGKIKAIREQRSKLRLMQRSSHNRYLTTEVEEDALADVSDRGDLVVIAGIFNSYVEALTVLFEMGRIITNDYLNSQAQVNDIFEHELMPKYRYAERRRLQLRPRIKSKKFLPFLDELDYIAMHDSIAVYSMEAYLKGEKDSDLTTALKYGYQAKLMKKDFWSQFSYYLNKYEIGFVRNEKLWQRYFGSWDEVEP
ncbi:MAG: hypothetical protein JXQ83_14920 [Candidatus Glassbacteria bacterium]|nr:hypothetical protein [Candidatus Glassbacteria bacterium]